MLARRLALVTAGLLAIPTATVSAQQSSPVPPVPDSHAPTVTRAEVLSGQATSRESGRFFQMSLAGAGGEVIEIESTEQALGGYSYPMLAVDLDGDGDDESLLQQIVGRKRLVVAIDEGEILWREKQPRRSYALGTLTGDLVAGEGDEVLLVVQRWKDAELRFSALGVAGQEWKLDLPIHATEMNGLVQADGDAQDELALSLRDQETGELTIGVFDGETGEQIADYVSTPAKYTEENWSSEAFVTDGPAGAADEVVFATPMVGGMLYAERINLATGVQTAFNVVPNVHLPTLYQGVDFTGDGRRDGFAETHTVAETGITSAIGVFGATDLKMTWTRAFEFDYFYFAPYLHVGDANGDSGQDLCLFSHTDEWGGEEDSMTRSESAYTCFSGASGTDLWTATRGVDIPDGSYGHTEGFAQSDVNGDGVLDPILDAYTVQCAPYPEPCTMSYSATAHSGKDGSALWTMNDSNARSFVYDLTAHDLDGAAGDDAFVDTLVDGQDVHGMFAVYNGLSRAHAWAGRIQMEGDDIYVDGVLAPDLDGDGDGEVLITVASYIGIGEPQCEVWEDYQYCWYEDYEEHAHVAAFEAAGPLLWQTEL
jgi:hypothetical protein